MRYELPSTSTNDNGYNREGQVRDVEGMRRIAQSAQEAVELHPHIYLGGREFPIANSHDFMFAEKQRIAEAAEQLLENARQRLAEVEKQDDNALIREAEQSARACEMFVQAMRADRDMSGIYLDALNTNVPLARFLEETYPYLPQQLHVANEHFSVFEEQQKAA